MICPGKNENFIINPGGRSRYLSQYYGNKYNKEKGILDQTFKFKGVITKIVMKTSPWQNESVIQGMRVYFNDGKIKNIGVSAEEKLLYINFYSRNLSEPVLNSAAKYRILHTIHILITVLIHYIFVVLQRNLTLIYLSSC